MILRPLRFVHPVLQRTQTELKTQKKNYADVASCKFFARHLCRSSARKQSIWRVFQTGGYAAFSSICLSCFGLRIVFLTGQPTPWRTPRLFLAPGLKCSREFIPNFGERRHQGETISTAFVESTINQVVSKRFVKKQQMQWTLRGALLLLQTRTKVLNEDLDEVFRHWYPKFRPQPQTQEPELKALAQ